MTDEREIRTTFCTHCTKEVKVAVSPGTPRNGQANLQESDEVVCLDFGDKCDGDVCPLSQYRPVVMGVRLARSGLREEWTTIRAQCEGCGLVGDLKVLDREHAFCVLCGTTNTWMILEFDNKGKVAVTGRKDG
jgi:hypothetical protein